jgi:hypothetical protein
MISGIQPHTSEVMDHQHLEMSQQQRLVYRFLMIQSAFTRGLFDFAFP